MIPSNEEIVAAYVAHFNAGDLNLLGDLFTPDAEIHGVLGWGKLAEVMPIWKQLVDSLEIHLEILDTVSQGNKIAVRYREKGYSKATFFGNEATGKSYELLAMEWFEIKKGKIHRRWGARDAASQARQLGWKIS